MRKICREIAREWIEGRLGEGRLADSETDRLTRAIEAAYDAGVAEGKASATVEEPQTQVGLIRSRRQEEELTRRTLQVLGADRTLETLRRTPNKRRVVAAHAKVEPEVLRVFLEGRPVSVTYRTQIAKSLKDLGFESAKGHVSAGQDGAVRQPLVPHGEAEVARWENHRASCSPCCSNQEKCKYGHELFAEATRVDRMETWVERRHDASCIHGDCWYLPGSDGS